MAKLTCKEHRILLAFTRGRKSVPFSYLVLTVCIFVPLVFAFVFQIQFYPIPVWTLFTEAVSLDEGRHYYVLRGETEDGESIDIPAIDLTDALSGRNFMMLSYVLEKASFCCDSPHPHNIQFRASQMGSDGALHKGARIDDLLRSWGRIYNEKFPKSSHQRLTAIRLDGYRWPGKEYGDYRQPADCWRAEL
jgi:hypothetical protein